MTPAHRFPYAALAAPFAPEDRDRFAARLMGSRAGMTLERAAGIAAYIASRRTRARQG
jgi:hypothetical protein